ncbi:MAG TPA: MerR family transcriptional regulator [Polyangiaceae bacterium]|nr:MerR family transcriptional regulator [Polyangiaceae bacterium]
MDRLKHPVKLYYRIGEVSDIVGVEPHVLRYWETEFRSIRPQKSRKGQRIYSRRDVEKLITVKDLLYSHGFTIAGARKKLREGGTEPVAAEPQPKISARARLLELRSEVVSFLSELESGVAVEARGASAG